MTKDLKEKAIDIKGKDYVQVHHRVMYLNETYPSGCIVTYMLSEPVAKMVIFKAEVYPEGLSGRKFTGHSQAVWGNGHINKDSALENAETSAVGRALAFMGIGVIDGIASVDEINKALSSTQATREENPFIDSDVPE